MMKPFQLESLEDLSGTTTDTLEQLIEELCQIDQQHFPWPWKQEHWQVLTLDFHLHRVYFYRNDGQMIGFSLFLIFPEEALAHLLKIVVVPSKQRQGAGRLLLQESMEDLKKQGVSAFYLEVACENTPAIKLYERLGFRVIHRCARFYSDGADAFKMLLHLSK